MSFFSLEDKIRQSGGNPAVMLRREPSGPYAFPFQEQFTNWRDEETAWATTATLFDQSFHMNDVSFTGPDVQRLFSENSVNNYDGFARNRAKQVVAVTTDGDYIGDGIAFAFEDDAYVLVGAPAVSDWMSFRARTGGYDVEVEADPATPFNPNPRKKFRFQLQGPRSLDTIRAVAGDVVDSIRFFRMGEFQIAGVPIRALNHTMVGVPGQEHTGLEMTGPWEEHDRVLDALRKAGEQFGMRMGGSLAYSATAASSGWVGLPLPGIYTGDGMKSYRQSLSGDLSFEAIVSIAGSLESDDVRDYYNTPWDLGYGRVVDFGHEFVGRDALLARQDEPHRVKVFLRWEDQDAADVIASSLFDYPDGAKFMEMPSAAWGLCHYDEVRVDGRPIGWANWAAYVTNFGGWVQLGMLDAEHATDGTEVEVRWGNESAIGVRPLVEPHRERGIRARVHTTPPLKAR